MSPITIIAHNIRSTYNVGALFRSADCFGVEHIIFSGYSPYPSLDGDTRLPHIAQKLTDQIHKTALGTEKVVPFSYIEDIPFERLRQEGYRIVALEQADSSISIQQYSTKGPIALLIGEEVNGIEPALLALCDDIIEIPQFGKKESLNVSVATGIALYAMRTSST